MNLKTTVTLTVSTTPAYTSGDCVGGKLTIPVKANQPLVLTDICVVDLDNQKAAFDILFFDADTAAGPYTDNGALTLHATDTPKIIARVPVAAADYVTLGTRAVARVANVGAVVFDQDCSESIFAIINTTSTPTYTTTASLTLKLGFTRN